MAEKEKKTFWEAVWEIFQTLGLATLIQSQFQPHGKVSEEEDESILAEVMANLNDDTLHKWVVELFGKMTKGGKAFFRQINRDTYLRNAQQKQVRPDDLKSSGILDARGQQVSSGQTATKLKNTDGVAAVKKYLSELMRLYPDTDQALVVLNVLQFTYENLLNILERKGTEWLKDLFSGEDGGLARLKKWWGELFTEPTTPEETSLVQSIRNSALRIHAFNERQRQARQNQRSPLLRLTTLWVTFLTAIAFIGAGLVELNTTPPTSKPPIAEKWQMDVSDYTILIVIGAALLVTDGVLWLRRRKYQAPTPVEVVVHEIGDQPPIPGGY